MGTASRPYNVTMRFKDPLIAVLLVSFALLPGCFEPQAILVRRSNVKEVSGVLKDYAGINNYRISYANEDRGIFRVVIREERHRTVEHMVTRVTQNVERSISETIEKPIPEEYFVVQLVQTLEDVELINVEVKNSDEFSGVSFVDWEQRAYINDFMRYLRNCGFTVEIVARDPQAAHIWEPR